MKVEFIKLHENAQMPVKKNTGDFCYDVYCAWVEQIDDNYLRYHTGLAVQIVRAPELLEIDPNNLDVTGIDLRNSPIRLSIDARPRSSVWKTGLILSNCEGTIDEGYTGEICAVFYHADKSKVPYEAGDRIMQIKLGFTLPIEFEQVSAFQPTEYNTARGDKGYGSTGNK